MAIIGHKERSLLRRGTNVQESLKRRMNLTESASLRRTIVEEPTEGFQSDKLKLHGLCGDDISAGIKQEDSVYCSLVDILNKLKGEDVEKTHQAITNIYKFFKPEFNDNRSLFKRTIKVILNNENPSNALILIAKFLGDPEFNKEEVKRALVDLRTSKKDIPQNELEDFLKKARFMEYTKYENSFVGANFDSTRGKITLSRGTADPLHKVIYSILIGRTDINDTIQRMADAVLSTDISKLLNKADLKLKTNLVVGDKIIVPKDGKVEVKKMNPDLDSYFSEFFAIYKDSSLPDVAFTPEFLLIYNKVIDGVFEIVRKRGQALIDSITSGFEAIMYDDSLLILKNDIELYWSNKGQRACNEHRLSIRYRLKNSKIKAYLYDVNTHSNQLTPQDITITVRPQIICPIVQ